MYDQVKTAGLGQTRQYDTPQVASRIDAEVERIRSITASVWQIQERIMRHAKALGFYQETSTGAPHGTLQDVPVTLREAVDQLEMAVQNTVGCLNVFD